jgi:hypothetical protein
MPDIRRQFSVRSLMTLVLVVAGSLTLYRTVDRSSLAFGVLGLFPTFVFGTMVRNRRRFAIWVFGIASLASNGLIALICAYLVSIGGYILIILVSLSLLPAALGCGVAWARLATATDATKRRPPWVAWGLVVVFCGAPLTMIANLWPLRVAFLLSRPSLNAMADRVAAGHPVVGPEQAGLYEIVRSVFDPETGEVALFIDDDPAGRSGFLRLPSHTRTTSSRPFTNLNFNEHLDERWRYQNED